MVVLIKDALKLHDVIGDVLERSLSIHHQVQNAAKGPHITCTANLMIIVDQTKFFFSVFNHTKIQLNRSQKYVTLPANNNIT